MGDKEVHSRRIKELEHLNAQLQDRLEKLLALVQSRQSHHVEPAPHPPQKQQLKHQEPQVSSNGNTPRSPTATSPTSTSTPQKQYHRGSKNNKSRKKNNDSNQSLHRKAGSSDSVVPTSQTSKVSNRGSFSGPELTPASSMTSSQFSLISDSTTNSEVLFHKLEQAQQKTNFLRGAYDAIKEDVLQLRSQHAQCIRDVKKELSNQILEQMRVAVQASAIHNQNDQLQQNWEQLYLELKNESEQTQIEFEKRLIRSKEQWQQRSEEQQHQSELYLKKAFEIEKAKELNTVQQECRTAREELENVKEEYKKLRTQSRGLTRRNEEYKEKLKIYETQIQQLAKESEQVKAFQTQLEQQQTLAKDMQSQLETSQEQLQHALQALEKEQKAHQAAVHFQTQHGQAHQAQLEELRLQLAKAHSTLDEDQRRMSVLTEEMNTSKALFASKSAELDALQLQMGLEAKKHQESIQERARTLSSSQSQLEQIRHEKGVLERTSEKRIQELTAQLESLGCTLHDQQQQCDSLAAELENSKSEHQDLLEHFQLLQSQLQDTESSLNESQMMLNQFEQTKEHYSSLQELHQKLSLDMEKIEVREQQLKQVNRSLKEEVKKLHLRNSPRSGSIETTAAPSPIPVSPALSTSSGFNVDYLKSVLFKFLTNKKQMRFQLIPVLSMLLQCTEDELNTLNALAGASD